MRSKSAIRLSAIGIALMVATVGRAQSVPSTVRVIDGSGQKIVSNGVLVASVPKTLRLTTPPAEQVPTEPRPKVVPGITFLTKKPPAKQRPFPEDDPQTRMCVEKASTIFHVETMPLYVILDVEGGTVGENSKLNKDLSYDIGKAQINSQHLGKLAARGIDEATLRNNLCVNIFVQAWLYKDGRSRSKSMAEAIALYHSPTPEVQAAYLQLIEHAIERRQARMAQQSSEKI
jgi:hypothetical protein